MHYCLTKVGRLCERQESPAARTARVTCASKEDYIRKVLATTPDCKTGQPGTLVWTPDKKTPDIVYYQVNSLFKLETSFMFCFHLVVCDYLHHAFSTLDYVLQLHRQFQQYL